MEVGVLIISTGKYDVFLQPLAESIAKHFLLAHEVTIFSFGDKNCKFHMDHKPFPYPTLMRYHQFNKQKDELSKMDYLFYCDVDMLFVRDIGSEILSDGLTACIHPYSESRSFKNTFELNKNSTAYTEDIDTYCCGGFQGGTSEAFLRMSEQIAMAIDIDLQNGIVARWHDETHYNKYLTINKPSKILSRDYCTPEKERNIDSKLLALDKEHEEIRN
jgi:histo-blood group ABO system transferase|tara:strand:- start:2257 stop:2907 length:651 start_codon:yes stop_codon:yes gene_type:complete